MPELALSAVGRDRPGIVAAVAQALFLHGVNVADSQMTNLGGHFAMTLLVTAPDGTDLDGLRSELDRTRDELQLEAMSLNEVGIAGERSSASHVVTVYGADHPGIVLGVTAALAAAEVNVTDLSTRLAGDEEPLYAMIIEVSLPEGADPAEVEASLRRIGGEQGVEVVLRELGQDAL